jgi:hypothetical protein
MQAREQYTPSLWGVTTYGNVYQSTSHAEANLPKEVNYMVDELFISQCILIGIDWSSFALYSGS